MSNPRDRPPPLVPPAGLRATALHHEGVDYVVVSYPTSARPELACLSPSEREVAALVLRGLSNAAIARARGVAVRTVANQLASMFKKLHVGSRTELATLLAGR